MTAPKTLSLEEAEAERGRLAAAARAAGEIADKLADERWAAIDARRQDWGRLVLADATAVGSALAAAETVAARAFRLAAIDGDSRQAYFTWLGARLELNMHRDRLVAARSALGEPQVDSGYPITDTPSFSAELDRALAAEASNRFADAQAQLQRELSALDEIGS